MRVERPHGLKGTLLLLIVPHKAVGHAHADAKDTLPSHAAVEARAVLYQLLVDASPAEEGQRVLEVEVHHVGLRLVAHKEADALTKGMLEQAVL
eukprot:764642-Hanusia_phi.AAC.2